MESGMKLDPQICESLRSAMRIGDADLVEEYLSQVSNPNEYFEKTYDEENMQKLSLLMIACLNGHELLMKRLIKRFQPNLEVKNCTLFGEENQSQQMCMDVTILWAAAAINNFPIVKLLVENGANVNHTTRTNSTPLRSVCYNGNVELARYFINNGADVHIAKHNNDTNLALSVYRKHLDMTRYLVEELQCDVNRCDDDGRSPLYDAVICGSLPLVQYLIGRGARNFPALVDQMSPLMWAAEKCLVEVVDVIASTCSLLENIEAHEILASSFACTCISVDERDLDKSVEYFTRALELRQSSGLQKPLRTAGNDVFKNRQECQTIEEFNKLCDDPSQIIIEGLIARERLLGPKSSDYRDTLRYHGAVLADKGQHDQALDFWMYELRLRQEHSIDIDSNILRQFASLLSDMINLSLTIPINHLSTIIYITSEEVKRQTENLSFNLHTFLFLITIASQCMNTVYVPLDEFQIICRYIRSIIKQNYATVENGSTLLHLAVNENTSEENIYIDRICRYPCPFTVYTLLLCDADMNAKDISGNTPLHIFVSNQNSSDQLILNLLCENGTHLHNINHLKQTPLDLASNVTTKKFIQSRMRVSLKCSCVQLIQKYQIPYCGKLSHSLMNFIEQH